MLWPSGKGPQKKKNEGRGKVKGLAGACHLSAGQGLKLLFALGSVTCRINWATADAEISGVLLSGGLEGTLQRGAPISGDTRLGTVVGHKSFKSPPLHAKCLLDTSWKTTKETKLFDQVLGSKYEIP